MLLNRGYITNAFLNELKYDESLLTLNHQTTQAAYVPLHPVSNAYPDPDALVFCHSISRFSISAAGQSAE